jgi:hypothetical protein
VDWAEVDEGIHLELLSDYTQFLKMAA